MVQDFPRIIDKGHKPTEAENGRFRRRASKWNLDECYAQEQEKSKEKSAA